MGDTSLPVLYRLAHIRNDKHAYTLCKALGFPETKVTGAGAILFITFVFALAGDQFVLLRYPMIALASSIA